MTQDARQSLIALGSVVVWVGFAVMFLRLSKGSDIPDWVLPLGLLLMTIDLVWRAVRWLRSRRNSPK
jgi:protein-S-isoprenylcysteine O-methyltransferase Ste14